MGGTKGILKARFAVGRAGGARASIWRIWSHGNDVYATTVDVECGVSKYSFHETGICSYGILAEKWSRADIDRRALKWKRMPTPPLGSSTAAAVLTVFFPTDHLSTTFRAPKKTVQWIEPAPPGWATGVDMLFTRESRERLEATFAVVGALHIVAYHMLPSGEAFVIVYSHSHCGDQELRMPASHGGSAVDFPAVDRLNTGRPVRVRFHAPMPPRNGDRLFAWELGGHAQPAGSGFRAAHETI